MKSGINIGEELLTWRKTNDLSRDDAAGLLGVSAVSLQHWESGRSCGMVGPIRQLMAALDCVKILKGDTR